MDRHRNKYCFQSGEPFLLKSFIYDFLCIAFLQFHLVQKAISFFFVGNKKLHVVSLF